MLQRIVAGFRRAWNHAFAFTQNTVRTYVDAVANIIGFRSGKTEFGSKISKSMKTLLIKSMSQLRFDDCADGDETKYRYLDIYSIDLKDYIAKIRMTDEGELRLEISTIYTQFRAFEFTLEVIEELISISKDFKIKMLDQLG
jgi:hypothetical protein